MDPDELSSKFQAWKTDVEIPRRFQAEVWRRIAAREEARRRSLWNRVRDGLLIQLAKPQYATALIAVSICASLGVAHLQARGANAKHWRQLETRYVNSITPFPAPSA
ncbi:MAG: hypothetical protein ABI871_06125 [Chthoniobacterales bacterium]